jgi:hypothetical protein
MPPAALFMKEKGLLKPVPSASEALPLLGGVSPPEGALHDARGICRQGMARAEALHRKECEARGHAGRRAQDLSWEAASSPCMTRQHRSSASATRSSTASRPSGKKALGHGWRHRGGCQAQPRAAR